MTEATSMPWVKVYTEFLDDPKIGKLPNTAKLRFIQLVVLAGECDADGMLINGDVALDVADIAWRLRDDATQVATDIATLKAAGIISEDDGALCVTNFKKRQGRKQSERQSEWRKRQQAKRERDSHESNESVTRDSRVTRRPRGEERREEERRVEESLGASAPGAVAPSPASSTTTPADILRVNGSTTADATKPTSNTAPSMVVPPELQNQAAPKREYQILGSYPSVKIYEETMCVTLTKLERRTLLDAIGRDCPDRWSDACTRWAERVVTKRYNAHNVPGVVDVWRNGCKFNDEKPGAIASPSPNGAAPSRNSAYARAISGSRNGKTFTRAQVTDSTDAERAQAQAEARRRNEARARAGQA